MIRKRKLFPALLVAGLAAASLLFTWRGAGDKSSTPRQAEFSRDYFFRDARMALTGEDGRTEMEIEAGTARREIGRDSALKLQQVSIRRGNPPTLSLAADSALLPREGADLEAEGKLRLTFGPDGAWMAMADHARLQENGASVTLTGNVSFSRAGGAGNAPAITGQHLVLDVESMTARTGRPVRVRIGEVVFEADGLQARVADETITLDSNVQAIINP